LATLALPAAVAPSVAPVIVASKLPDSDTGLAQEPMPQRAHEQHVRAPTTPVRLSGMLGWHTAAVNRQADPPDQRG